MPNNSTFCQRNRSHDDVAERFYALHRHLNLLEKMRTQGHRGVAGSELAVFKLDEQIDRLYEQLLAMAWVIADLPSTTANIMAKAAVVEAFASDEPDDIVHSVAYSLAQTVLRLGSHRA